MVASIRTITAQTHLLKRAPFTRMTINFKDAVADPFIS